MVAPAAITRAAIYARQSLDVQEGIDRQRDRCRKLAEAREWTVVDEYIDNDTSASKRRGPGTAWWRLLADAKAGRFDVVIAVDIDRLLRTIGDLVTLTDTGAKVLTVDGEIDLTTADGEFRATMLAAIARFEARRKSERQIRANEHAAAQGRRTGGRRPFGYEPDGETVRESEAVAVRDGYRALLTGVPLAAIARDWNARGFSTGVARYKGPHRGEPSPWTAGAVRQVLLNPRNMGKRAYRGEIVADAVWPAIVDESTWLSVEAVLNDPSRRMSAKRGRYLLSGLAVCGVCRGNVHAGGAPSGGGPTYRCGGSMGHFSRKAPPVEEYVQAVMVARLSKPDARALLIPRPRHDGRDLNVEAIGLRARLDALAIEFADGHITASQMRKATERLRARLGEVEALMSESARVDALAQLLKETDVATAWEALEEEKRRAIIAALATVVLYPVGRGRIKFDPTTVGIEWKS